MRSNSPIQEYFSSKCHDSILIKSVKDIHRVFRLRSGRLLVILSVTMTCSITLLVIVSLCLSCPMVATPVGGFGRTEEESVNTYRTEDDFQFKYQGYVPSISNDLTNKLHYQEDNSLDFRDTYESKEGLNPSSYDEISRNGGGETKKQLPQAIIIGVKKAGTRALLEFLRIHPDVRAPGPEPHFFDRYYHKGLEWYRNQMPTTLEGQVTMEKTPSYFITKEVPGRIRKMSPDTKLIVVVRDPVTRAISDYTQASSKRTDIKAFEELAFVDNNTGIVDTSWGAIRIGVYAKHLEKWLNYFPLSQIHFVSGERLITEPAKEVSRVQAFLGLKPVINDKHFYFNTTKGFPCLKKPEHSGNPHCLGRTKGRAHPKIASITIQRLKDFYRPFNQKFYQMVGHDFGWDA